MAEVPFEATTLFLTTMTGIRILNTGGEDGKRRLFKFWHSRPFLSLPKQPKFSQVLFFLLIFVPGWVPFAAASDATTEFVNRIRPLLVTHCLECHSTEVQKAGFDLQRFATLDEVRAELESWQEMLAMLESKEMPPERNPQPSAEDREALITWIRNLLRQEADLHAGDPGPVVIRRLNNAEYRYTIRDLTGVDLRPTSQFPADGAAGEGFLNATDTLAISSGLMNKYLDAAKNVAAHAVLLPDGFDFSDSKFREDWVNEVLDEILELYARYLTELGEIPLDRYLAATIMHFDELSSGGVSLEQVADTEKLSPKYLETVWQLVTDDEASVLVQEIQAEWNDCRAAASTSRTGSDGPADASTTQMPVDLSNLLAKIATWQGILWRRQRSDSSLGTKISTALKDRFAIAPISLAESHVYQLKMPGKQSPEEEEEEEPEAYAVFYLATQTLHGNADQASVILQHPRFESCDPTADEGPLPLREALQLASQETIDQAPDPPEGVSRLDEVRLENPSEDQLPAEDSLVLHGSEIVEVRLPAPLVEERKFVVEVRPDSGNERKTLVRFEARLSPTPTQIERTLKWSGYEQPVDLPLLIAGADEEVRDEISCSIEELQRVFPISLCYPGLIVRDTVVTLERFHRGDNLLSELMLSEQEHQLLDQLWQQLHYISQDAKQVRDSFATLIQGEMKSYEPVLEEIHRRADETEQMRLESEPSHVESLLDFADRAYRRPLTGAEQQALDDLYQSLRQDDLPHEEAFRSVLARILVSPNFLFRIEQPSQGNEAAPINDLELATRLSYFLWSTMPDEELRQTATGGRLRDPQVLAQQTRRMLQDPKSRGLAIEFGTQWLEIRSFDRFQGKNQEQFPMFDGSVRQAMYEESILFFQDLFQTDRSLWQLIDADHTFLNETLAKYYGIPGIEGDEFRYVEGVKTYGRGGMLGWASVLAKHSGASRTSPVLRGNWIAETVLGQRLPRPPPDVPKLPEDETAGELTIRQLVEKHTELQQCAVCHERIDPLGFALEQYDTIGRWREKDLGGRLIDAKAALKDGTRFEGIDGLRQYLLTQRKDDFLQQFCRKLLGYALGRGVILSDRQLLEEMVVTLNKNDGPASAAILAIVASKQFQTIRGSELVE